MSTSKPTKKMQIKKPVAKFVKRIVRLWGSTPNWRANGLDHIYPPSQPRATAVPILTGNFSPPPLTLPVSPKLGRSSATILYSPRIWAEDMERSDSAGTSGEGGALTTESGLTALSGTSEGHSTSSVFQSVTTGLIDSQPEPVKEASEGEEPSGKLPVLSSPPQEHAEPEVPDPFLVDDSEESLSDEDLGENENVAPVDEMPPAEPTTPITPASLVPNVNKAVPPPPPPDTDEDSDDAPDLYLPGLVIPAMFLPIPNTDPLTTLVSKYIIQPEQRPVRDLTGDWQQYDFHTLVMTNSWRALARMARDRIVTTNPEDLNLILGLWYLRLSSLARLRLYNQTSAEITSLFTVLHGVAPLSAREWLFDRLLPFELEVMYARVKYWAGDHMGYLDALNGLLKKCRGKGRAAKGDETNRAMWRERGARICLIMASQLVEMKDFVAAVHLLEPLTNQGPGVSTAALRSATARIYLQAGYLAKAIQHFVAVEADPEASQEVKDMNAALLASAEGDWLRASELLKGLLAADSENYAAVNNLSVALLSQGKLKEGIEVLETALQTSPSTVVVAEPFLFNLSTLYELRSATAVDKKRALLIEVAKWSGDGLKTTCLKMPAN